MIYNWLRLSKCWLPNPSTQRTKSDKTITEKVLYFYRFRRKSKILCFGNKPDFIPKNKIFTKRDYRSHLSKSKRKNPILEGYKYLEYLESDFNFTYRDVAKNFNVTKARVCQVIALVKKLPKQITDFFIKENETLDFSYFTGRRLRPLTLLQSDKDKIERFEEMKKA